MIGIVILFNKLGRVYKEEPDNMMKEVLAHQPEQVPLPDPAIVSILSSFFFRRVRWSKIYFGLLLFILLNNGLVYASDCWETCFAESERGTEHAEYEQVIGLLQSFKKALQTDANTGSGASNGNLNLLTYFLYILRKSLHFPIFYDSKMILFKSKNHCNIFVPNDKFQTGWYRPSS